MRKELALTRAIPGSTLGLGGELKNTLCCVTGKKAYLSGTFSDLKDAEVFDGWLTAVESMPEACGMIPESIAYDLHPEYLSHKAAKRADLWPGVLRAGIQHHEAHVASCAAAEGIWHTTLGLAFDGTGYGTDGTIWGGEIFSGSIEKGFKRTGRFRPFVLPGGEAAIREPWRLAAGLACEAELPDIERYWPDSVGREQWEIVIRLCRTETIPRIMTSSAGRLFDGISALLGICTHAGMEAEAAIALERAAGVEAVHRRYTLQVTETAGILEIDWRPMIREIDSDLRAGIRGAAIAAAFHDSLAATVAEVCADNASREGTVVGSGGVFWNKRFSKVLGKELELRKLQLITSGSIPPSDAGLSLGQAVLAGFRGTITSTGRNQLCV